jgi:hypothetical protein
MRKFIATAAAILALAVPASLSIAKPAEADVAVRFGNNGVSLYLDTDDRYDSRYYNNGYYKTSNYYKKNRHYDPYDRYDYYNNRSRNYEYNRYPRRRQLVVPRPYSHNRRIYEVNSRNRLDVRRSDPYRHHDRNDRRDRYYNNNTRKYYQNRPYSDRH